MKESLCSLLFQKMKKQIGDIEKSEERAIKYPQND
jgi:hypothetical protein